MTTQPAPRIGAVELSRRLGQTYAPTAEQVAVIEAPLRSTLVVAGAGSGKTETMTARIVWLVANDLVRPEEVLGLTFTRKAAGELADRVTARLDVLRSRGVVRPADPADDLLGGTPTISTYHSYAGSLVREHAMRLGHEPDSRLLAPAAAWQYAHEVVRRWEDPLTTTKVEASVTAAVVSLAGELAEHLRTPEEIAAWIDDLLAHLHALPPGPRRRGPGTATKRLLSALAERRSFLPLVSAYLDRKASRDATDFADQVALAATGNANIEQVPVRSVTTTASAGGEKAPTPQTRPAAQPVENARPAQEQAALPAETQPAQQVATASVPAGGYFIQVASLPSEAEAQKSYNSLSNKFGSVIGGRGVDIRKAEIAGKGTYYRVRIPAGSKDEANALCSKYKGAGGSCLVTK